MSRQSTPIRLAIIAFLALLQATTSLAQQAADPVSGAAGAATAPAKPRPRIALVLSGGGARGLAHIGVLKALRDLRVPVDMIVATSMGSIVGGAYAAGRTIEDMEEILDEADWATIFSDRPPRADLSFRRKEDDLRFIGRTELGVGKDGLILPRGAFGTQNLEEFLRLLALPGSQAQHLDKLPIPLRAIATDLVSGELVVLRDVPLSLAMRASASIPGAFAPTRLGDRLLGDGGLTRNLPVEVAIEMGAEVIIAVNVGTPLLPRESLSSALGVAQQMINILTEQNVGISLRALRPGDILISPELAGISFIDFDRSAELISRGEAAARTVAGRLSALALDNRSYVELEARRLRPVPFAQEAVDAVVIQGAVRTNPEALANELQQRTDVERGKVATAADLAKASRVLYGTGEFERVDVRWEPRDGRPTVVLDVDEKPWGPNYLRIGGRAVSDFRTDGRFSVTLQHTRTWVNSWGAEWRNELQVGDIRGFATSFYQPLGPGSPWFVEPVFETLQSYHDVFASGNRRTDRITNEATTLSGALGLRLGNIGVARIALGHQHSRATPTISSRLEGTLKDDARFVSLGANFDTLDDANFPRAGYLVSLGGRSTNYSSGDAAQVRAYVAQALLPATFGRLTILGMAAAARSRDDLGGFTLGGFLNLSGTPIGAVSGSQAAIAAIVAYYRMGELPRVLGRSWYTGVSLEAGNAWARRADMRANDLRKAGSLFVGFDTVAGPFYLGWGHSQRGDSTFYLFVGRPTDHY